MTSEGDAARNAGHRAVAALRARVEPDGTRLACPRERFLPHRLFYDDAGRIA